MKQVKLHTGQILEFPPETADSIIDAAVRRELGVPDPVDYNKESHDIAQQSLNLSSEAVEGMFAIANMLKSMLPALKKISEMNNDKVSEQMDQISRALDENSRASVAQTKAIVSLLSHGVEHIAEIVEKGSQDIVSAYSAPRVLQRSPDNKTATLEIQTKEK